MLKCKEFRWSHRTDLLFFAVSDSFVLISVHIPFDCIESAVLNEHPVSIGYKVLRSTRQRNEYLFVDNV
jgi:hypothetical protein